MKQSQTKPKTMKHTAAGMIQIIAHARTMIGMMAIPVELKNGMDDGLNEASNTITKYESLESQVKELREATNKTLASLKEFVSDSEWYPPILSVLEREEMVKNARKAIKKTEQLLNKQP